MTPNDRSELQDWLQQRYDDSVRTAYLLLGNRADAEEAVQDAFLRAWRFRESLTDESKFQPWLYRIVVNSCRTKMRQEIRHRDRRASEDNLIFLAARDSDVSREQAHDVTDALMDLAPHLRLVVVLRYYLDLSERDIATFIDRAPGTVKSRLNEARLRLSHHAALSNPQLKESGS